MSDALDRKGGTVCVDTDSNDSATSCIASESDERLKENIISLSASSSLDTILALNPVSFDWRVHDADVLAHYPLISRFAGQPHSIGLIAQQVMPVLPEALSLETVGDREVQYFQLDYTKFIPHLIGAVQALFARVNDLAATVTTFADHFTTKELTFTRATGDEIDANTGKFKTLCVGETCLTESELQALLPQTGQSPAAAPAAPTAASLPTGEQPTNAATSSPQAAATSSPPPAPEEPPASQSLPFTDAPALMPTANSAPSPATSPSQ